MPMGLYNGGEYLIQPVKTLQPKVLPYEGQYNPYKHTVLCTNTLSPVQPVQTHCPQYNLYKHTAYNLYAV